MKLYREYPYAGIKMSEDPVLIQKLGEVKDEIEVIIESGTYNGLGSTSFLAEIFANAQNLRMLHTIEVNARAYSEAKKNLRRFPFVQCHYGCSVGIHEGLDFIENDEAILHHTRYPDIFIDDLTNPIELYSKELKGFLKSGPIKRISNWIKLSGMPSLRENLLPTLIKQSMNNMLLIVLDSAAGVGFLEFRLTLDLMVDRSFYLMLDDIHHLKHFRSRAYIEDNERFQVLHLDEKYGVMLAYAQPEKN